VQKVWEVVAQLTKIVAKMDELQDLKQGFRNNKFLFIPKLEVPE
jgi:hypothetical protein